MAEHRIQSSAIYAGQWHKDCSCGAKFSGFTEGLARDRFLEHREAATAGPVEPEDDE